MDILIVSADRTLPSGAPQNVGDALLTDMLSGELRRRSCDVIVADFGQGVRRDGASRNSNLGLLSLFILMRRCELILVGGGTLLQDDQPNRWFGGLPRLSFIVSILGWISRRPVVYFGVGADPVSRLSARLLLRAATFKRRIYCRDRESVDRVATLFRRRATLAADVCLLGGDSIRTVVPAVEGRCGVGLCLNRRDSDLAAISSISSLRSEFGEVVFFSMDQGDAADHLALHESVQGAVTEFGTGHSWREIAARLSRLEYVASSRMHGLYLAGLLGVPAIGIGTSPKLRSFCREFGVPCEETVPGADSLRAIARIPDFSIAARRVAECLDEVIG